MKKRLLIILLGALLIGGSVTGYVIYKDYQRKQEEKLLKEQEEKLLAEIKNKYSPYVITNQDAEIYIKSGKDYQKIGKIAKDTVLNLDTIPIDSHTKYFKIMGFDDEYYIKYMDVDKSEQVDVDDRYKSYIKFDKNIITKDQTNFYLNDKLIYTIDKSLEFPVYMIDNDKYYVEYNNQLLYILKKDIKSIKDVPNNEKYAKEVAVIVYHFVYDPSKNEKCNQGICHTVTQFNSHLDYIKNNNFFTPTMNEFELFMDGKIRLPEKTVMITIDDGWYAHNASRLLTEHKLNGTVFLITKSYKKEYVETEYVEAHSHTHNMHTPGACPNGQGGGIQCLDRQTILNDLKTSREQLGGSKALCYPFYEYNNYSISLLKEAGYTMGFAGYYANGSLKARVGADKYQIPRVTMRRNSSVSYLASIIN